MSSILNGMGRPKKPEPTDQVRIPRSVVRRIRRIALHLQIEPGEYIAQHLAAALTKDEDRMLKDIEKELKTAEPDGSKPRR